MSGLEGHSSEPIPKQETQEQAPAVELSELQSQTKDLMSKLDSRTMQTLGAVREAELHREVEQGHADAHSGLEELKAQVDALDMMEENFSSFEHYEQFTTMLDNGELSPDEVDGLL